MKGKGLIVLLALLAAGYYGYRYLPAQYNPFAPLRLEDPPGLLSHYKLRRLTPAECAGLLEEANRRKLISSQPVADSGGACPLQNVVRVRDFGTVKLSSSFLASCPLALSSALYLQQQAKPLTRRGKSPARLPFLAAMPAVIFTIARTRGAVSTLPRRRWMSAAFVCPMADESAC